MTLLLTAGILYTLVTQSMPAFKHFGFFSFFSSFEWNIGEEQEKQATLSFIIGTFSTAILALLISIPFALSLSLFNNIYCKKTKIAQWTSAMVDLFAQIPSVILGVWGYFSLRPLLHAGTHGSNIFATALVLALMIVPYIASISAYFFNKVPENIKEGAYCLGATHTEVIRKIYFPFAKKGIFIACFMALGKALGETMIVCMLAGNTITSLIVDQIENTGELKLSELFALALLLFLITAIVNSITIYIKKQIRL
jgi:phosphate transport system permease protein